MTEPRHDHLTDDELIARLDEPEAAPPATGRHLAACEPCRARLAAVEALFAELRAEPAADSRALAAQRERIAEAIRERPRLERPSARLRRAWLPLAAAAAIGAVVLLGRGGFDRGPYPGARTLAVDTAAQRAAEAALAALEGSVSDTSLTGIDPDLATTLVTDAAISPLGDRIAIEEELSALPADDQAAILAELETMTFDL